MARLFDDANTDYLSRTDILDLTDYPFSMACWFNSDVALNQTLMCFGSSGASQDYQEMRLRDPADSDVIMLTRTGTIAIATTSAQWSINTLHHACGVVAASNSRAVYLDGGNKGTNISNRLFSGDYDRTRIGVLNIGATLSQYMSGMIAEAGIWNVALTDAEVAVLAAGYSPLFVRPQNLVAYWPLVRGLTDPVGRYDMGFS